MEVHNEAVKAIAERVKEFHAAQRPFRIFHGSTNSTRTSQYTPENSIDVSALKHVLHVDTVKKIALVEPNVAMDGLIQATRKYGLIPPVIMEFPGITAGGGFSGTSGESSSFKYGYFDNTVKSVEMVLGNGDMVTARREGKYKDLFYSAAASFGTLGIVTLVEVRLVNSTDFVALTYHPVASTQEAVNMFEGLAKDESIDYLDGILFSPNSGVVMSGRRASSIANNSLPIQSFSEPQDPWFYMHAQSQLPSTTTPANHSDSPPAHHALPTETIPLESYLFRYDRGAFWMSRYTLFYFLLPNTRIIRRIFDPFLRTRTQYHCLHASGHADRLIVQDVAVPYAAAAELADFLRKQFRWYPLWLCPLKVPKRDGGDQMMLNFGVWGPGPGDVDACTQLNRAIEQKVHELDGVKWLYAHTYCEEEEFWNVYYDRNEYDALRKKYHADYLPTVFDKVRYRGKKQKRAGESGWGEWMSEWFWSVWPLSGLYGVLHAVFCTDYLMRRRGDRVVRGKQE